MNIHEYQAKQLLKKFNIPLLQGGVAHNPYEARQAAQIIGGKHWIVKAQIHAGGRGKGGGVKVAHSLDEVENLSKQIIGMNLVTPQTGPQGKIVQKVYIEASCQIQKEYYLSMVINHSKNKINVIASRHGGVDIEQVAAQMPDQIYNVYINKCFGLMPFQARQLAFKLGLPTQQFTKLLLNLYDAFIRLDTSLLELNPFVTTADQQIIALDAKMSFDDNALHPDIVQLRDITEEDPAELEASKYNLAFIKLDGQIGCLVNGAGLAMATMDIIKLHGGEPANFLDVGGTASKENVTQAFKIILKDKRVKGILVNIFGGIMKCNIIAEGIIAATEELKLHVPLVVRLEGTNVEQGKKLLESSSLNIIAADDLADAANKITTAVA